jgi:RHS repeat-associated protein
MSLIASTTGLTYDLTTTVVAGDQISFVINRNGNSMWDSTNFDPTVTFTSGGTSANLNWVVTDQLGTARMIFDQTGALTKRHDYLPFGEELFANQGSRTTTQGYPTSPNSNDNVRQKFTQKERDSETGLDYFGARYYSSTQGRFASPDLMLSSGDVASPQSWNRYIYVGNNPLRYVDPLGLFEWDVTLGGPLTDQDLKTRSKDKKNYDKAQRKAYGHMYDKRREIESALKAGEKASHNKSLSAQQRGQIAMSVAAYGAPGQSNGVTVGLGNLKAGTGAQAQLTGYDRNAAGVVTGALVRVTVDENTSGQILAIAIAHEGNHVEHDQAAVWVWATGGTYQQARSSPANLTTYYDESSAYQVSGSMAMALRRPELTYSDSSGSYQIWRRGMQNVDQQALDGLLNGHYQVTPMSQGSKILP